MTVTTSYAVSGMSCQHCVDSVTAEVGKLAGVEQVDIDLAAGTVAVTSSAPLSVDEVRAAVDEAGFDLADAAAPPEGS
jgi:copper chaperone